MYKRLGVITGMPRSGTSWIGQIVESCSTVRYRMSPLFSYEFKNTVREGASREDWERVLRGSYCSNNEFMTQRARREVGEYPTFEDKEAEPEVLIVKFNRFQNLIEDMLRLFPELKMLALVRHPCGAIHSWLTAPKEFPPGADPLQHWRSGSIKKTGFGDFFGFEDWKWSTRLHMRLAEERKEQFALMRYEDIVHDPDSGARAIFDFFELPYAEASRRFVERSTTEAVPGDYSVFKNPDVMTRWQLELQPEIRNAIIDELAGTDLERFLG